MQVPKINILLTTLGITHDEIASATGVTRPMITQTINGSRTSKKTQDRIVNYIRERITTEALFGLNPTSIEIPSDQAKGILRSERKRADLSY
jgi:hypothetical protein